MTTQDVLKEVLAERERQDSRWGQQNHPVTIDRPHLDCSRSYFRHQYTNRANELKRLNSDDNTYGTLGWDHILLEEVYEALAEANPRKVREELIQVAAVAVAAIESLDRNELALFQGESL